LINRLSINYPFNVEKCFLHGTGWSLTVIGFLSFKTSIVLRIPCQSGSVVSLILGEREHIRDGRDCSSEWLSGALCRDYSSELHTYYLETSVNIAHQSDSEETAHQLTL
jgi:hypothetical protein